MLPSPPPPPLEIPTCLELLLLKQFDLKISDGYFGYLPIDGKVVIFAVFIACPLITDDISPLHVEVLEREQNRTLTK